jgi:hypothetical protein
MSARPQIRQQGDLGRGLKIHDFWRFTRAADDETSSSLLAAQAKAA